MTSYNVAKDIHAARHATGGPDPITPAAIGAATTASVTAAIATAEAASDAAGTATAAVAAEAAARNTAITTAINNLLNGAPAALDTLKELADAVNDDPSFAASVTSALAGKQPLDSDLTAIAALTTTSFGRAFLTMTDAAATKTALALVKGDVGLGNVDNTADNAKPVSTAQAAAFAPITTTTIDLIDRTNNTTETVPAGTTTNCATAGVTKTAPALDNPVATPPKRFAVKNLSTGSITVAYPDQAGGAQSLTMLPAETRTFRQKSTSGWGVESGAIALSTLDARYAQSIPLLMSRAGLLSVSTGSIRIPVTRAMTIVRCRAMLGTAPTGSSVIADVKKNGTTLFTTTANRPTIAAGANDSGSTVPDVTTLAAGDYLTLDVIQVGSTTQGADLCVNLEVV